MSLEITVKLPDFFINRGLTERGFCDINIMLTSVFAAFYQKMAKENNESQLSESIILNKKLVKIISQLSLPVQAGEEWDLKTITFDFDNLIDMLIGTESPIFWNNLVLDIFDIYQQSDNFMDITDTELNDFMGLRRSIIEIITRIFVKAIPESVTIKADEYETDAF